MRRFHPGTSITVSPGNLHNPSPPPAALMLNEGEVVLVMRGWYHYLLTPGFNFPKARKRAENTLVSSFIEIISFSECPLLPLSYSKLRAVCLLLEQVIFAETQSAIRQLISLS